MAGGLGRLRRAPTTAVPDRSQLVGEHDGGAIEQVDTAKALQERDGHRIGRHEGAHCHLKDPPQQVGCHLTKALIQPL